MPEVGRSRVLQSRDSRGIGKLIKDVGTLFSDYNAITLQPGSDVIEGSPEPYLSLKTDDKDLLKLASAWEVEWEQYINKEIKKKQKENKDYWKGEQYGWQKDEYSSVDNIIFSSSETLLPIISRQNPEPLITSPDIKVADAMSELIRIIEDENSLKTKIKKEARHWLLNYVGVLKTAIDDVGDIRIYVIHPDDIILDPYGNFEGGEFTGKYIGEKKVMEAEKMLEMFSDASAEAKAAIKGAAQGAMGTRLKYKEWWTNEYVFWTFNGYVLDKRKNPNWNYEDTLTVTDEYGNETEEIKATRRNHFKTSKKPYSFLSVFNLGKHPLDDTGLVEQSIPLQDAVNKAQRQIDKNADDANSGWVFNQKFTTDTARTALQSLRNGGAILTQTQSVQDAVTRINAPNLPNYVINNMTDKREQIQSIMGTRGSTASGIASEQTVRGKIEVRQSDVDRSALIVEHIEQQIDYLFNYITQMVFVYYTEKDIEEKIGEERGLVLVQYLKNLNAPALNVSVKEGSLIPQDPLLRRNEAVELLGMGIIDPLTAFERMNFANPEETFKRLVQYQTNPTSLLEEGEQAIGDPNMPALPPMPPII